MDPQPKKRTCDHTCNNCGHVCKKPFDNHDEKNDEACTSELLNPITQKQVEDAALLLGYLNIGETQLNDEFKWMDENYKEIHETLLNWYNINEKIVNSKLNSWTNFGSNFMSSELTEEQLKRKISKKDLDFINLIISQHETNTLNMVEKWITKSDKREKLYEGDDKKILEHITNGTDTSVPKEYHSLIIKIYSHIKHGCSTLKFLNEKIKTSTIIAEQLQNDWDIRNQSDAAIELQWIQERLVENKKNLETNIKEWEDVKKKIIENYNLDFSTETTKYSQDVLIKAKNLLDKKTKNVELTPEDYRNLLIGTGIAMSGWR